MLIKSGEGVVYLTRPQKYFSSSSHPQKLNLSFQTKQRQTAAPATQTLLPRPTKKDANSPNMASSLRKKWNKVKK